MKRRKTLQTATIALVLFVFLLQTFSFVRAENGLNVLDWRTMSVPPPPETSLYVILAIWAVVVVLMALGAAVIFKRQRKLVIAITIIALAVIGVVAILKFTEAVIYYSFDAEQIYPRNGDNFVTVNCRNAGYAQASFSLVLQFENANISAKTQQPYELLSDSATKFTYTLAGGERQSTKAYFSIGENATEFNVLLTYRQQDEPFLIQADSEGDTALMYTKEPFTDNFTLQYSPPPP